MNNKKINIKNIFVAFDIENISHKHFKQIIDEIKKYGDIKIINAYGDFNRKETMNWKDIRAEYPIKFMHKSFTSIGKNSTDSFIVVNAMDILHTKKEIDTIAIITNDSDFTTLAQRFSNSKKAVIGMSYKNNTNKAFKKSCNIFKYIDDLPNDQNDKLQKNTYITIKNFIVKILKLNGETLLTELKQLILKKYPKFDEKEYGKNKFKDFISEIREIKVTSKNNDTNYWASNK